MSDQGRYFPTQAPGFAAPGDGAAEGFIAPALCHKVLLLIESEEDLLAQGRALMTVLRESAHEIVIFTRSSGRLAQVALPGCRIVDFDLAPQMQSARRQASAAWSLARHIEAEAPDVVHAVGLRPAVLTAIAARIVKLAHVVVHMTEIGSLRIAQERRRRFVRTAALRLLGGLLRAPTTYLLVENKDDLALIRSAAADPGPRFAMLGGSGVDPNAFAALPLPNSPIPVAAFVSRISTPKGAHVFLQAFDMLAQSKVRVQPLLCGRSVSGDPECISPDVIHGWCQQHGGVWREYIDDITEVWRNADMYVLPSLGGEGMPKSMLEAAASQRPLIVSNVPGCKDFVRHGVEGLLVQPGDAQGLAQAIARLAADGGLRQRLGEGARLRLLHGFTEAHVAQTLREMYASMLMVRP